MDESNAAKPTPERKTATAQDPLSESPRADPNGAPHPDGPDAVLAPDNRPTRPTGQAAVAQAAAGETPPAAADETGPSEKYTVKLDTFEGPLDLLLYLIRREEVNIWDIPIARITAQYLEYIQLMQNLNLNVAGDFLVMAATLIYIKSRMLLPPDPSAAAEGATEEEDPRHELVYQLLEHQTFKNAAQMLYAKESVEAEVWNQPPREFIEEGEEMVTVTLFDLVRAYRDIVQRFTQRITLEYQREEVTVEEKISETRYRLLVQDRIVFSSLFEPSMTRRIMIVTFLAVLELVRLGEIKLSQDKAFSEIFLQRSARETQALQMSGEPVRS